MDQPTWTRDGDGRPDTREPAGRGRPHEPGDAVIEARGVLRACEVRPQASRSEGTTLVLVAAPDFDIADVCAEIGRLYQNSWPPVVVLPPAAAGVGERDLALCLERVTRAPGTLDLRRRFLASAGETLERADVSEDHYFFVDAGGDSITALQLSAAVEEQFGFELPLEVLPALTIGRIADLVATSHAAVAGDRSLTGP